MGVCHEEGREEMKMSFSRKASVWVGGDPSQVPLPVTVTSHRCVQAKQHFRPPPIHLHQDSALLPIFDNFIFLLLGFIYEPGSWTSGTSFLQDGNTGGGEGRKSLKGCKIQRQKQGSILEVPCFMCDNTFDIVR